MKLKEDLTKEKMISEYQSAKLLSIVKWINYVNSEIVKCYKYYYSVSICENDDRCLLHVWSIYLILILIRIYFLI
jgi:hypothetical protein